MTAPTTFPPKVEAYLAELNTHLEGTEPAARADTLLGVREHLHDALAAVGPDPSDAQVQAILDRLGPAKDVAGATDAKAGRQRLAAAWVAPIVLLLQLVGIAGSIFFLPIAALIAACVIVGLSPLWRPWEKITSIVASLVGLVTFIAAIAGMMMAANDCYDESTGQGMDLDTNTPIEGTKACSDVANSVNVGGVLIVALGALALAALIFLAIRGARRVDRTA